MICSRPTGTTRFRRRTLEVTKWIRDDEELKSIPIVAVTAFAMKGDEEKIRQGGCEAYIAKPISVVNFLETIERYVG
jgi:two-component system cell cycle response regulator DivK